MNLNAHYILVEKVEEAKVNPDGFDVVKVQDSFLYKGKVKLLPDIPVYVGNTQLQLGTIIVFKKYSADSFEYEGDKFIKTEDILAIV